MPSSRAIADFVLRSIANAASVYARRKAMNVSALPCSSSIELFPQVLYEVPRYHELPLREPRSLPLMTAFYRFPNDQIRSRFRAEDT